MRDIRSVRRPLAARAAIYCASILALPVLWSGSAGAAVTETVSIQNVYGFIPGATGTVSPQAGGTKETHYVGAVTPVGQSELGLNYTATADSTGFFFLHDNYCVGTCSTYSQTIITFTLTNNSEASVDLRFDSLITPGHIARITGDSALNGSFVFSVDQSVGRESLNLYNATGGVNSDGIFLFTGNLQFNGLNYQSDASGRWEVVDWGATNLNLNLATIAGGATTQITYTATYNTTSNGVCASVSDCPGLQVVFGDPRNNGGVSSFAPESFAANATDPVYPVIGRDYDPFLITAAFVPIDTPLPGNPEARPPVNYGGPLFVSRALAVPEPATWAMMIGGFGMAGGALRRRTARVSALA